MSAPAAAPAKDTTAANAAGTTANNELKIGTLVSIKDSRL